MSTNTPKSKASRRSKSVPNNSPRPRPYALSLDRSGGAIQADATGTNINSIVAQYKKNGTLPNVNVNNPLYGDYTFPEDIHSMLEAVHEAEVRFNHLPADVRTLCENDMGNFIEDFDNPEKREQMVNAGLKIEDSSPNQPPKTDTKSDNVPSNSTEDSTSTDTPKTQAAGGSGGLPPIVRQGQETPTT